MKKLLIVLALCSFNAYAQPININSADADTIAQSLSGVGQKKAEAIVQYRSENGAFESLQDVGNVKGIGDKTLQKNEQDILFSDAAAQ
ncbi:helix-hairpin-helix domain-containing protein [Methylomarinum sp. Ch1-1]|uniref:Helix-hairpin-helix domain-containing protein n=1 Tax=Methylomarinum roseum TaxID=3067653 RepID=A0AAU7NVZ1_9GAMM|nr:helix-hairpin-helix domain-containing protein [Methylomarinum sp. Ch1-1]MDP4522834.1 helix-hairpin-helix domain-containing protein [Methylomarinum sp. Ch1-1]